MNWDESNEYEPRATKNNATYQADGLAERVVVPGLKAVIVAIPAGLLAGLLIGAFGLAVSAWYAMPIVALAVFLVVFWGSSQRGQWLIERLVGADLNLDGYVGQPLPVREPPPLRVDVIQENGNVGDRLRLPYPDRMPLLAQHIIEGRSFSQDACNYLLSKSEFNTLRDELVLRNMAFWKNKRAPAQGVELTYAGKAVFRAIAKQPPTAPPAAR